MRKNNTRTTTKFVHRITGRRVAYHTIKKSLGRASTNLITLDTNGPSKFTTMALAGILAVISALTLNTTLNTKNTSAKYVLSTPPTYKANELTDFTLTRIIPSESYIEAIFDLLPGRDWHTMYKLNIGFGDDPSDYTLFSSPFNDIEGTISIYNQHATRLGSWLMGAPTVISKPFKQNGGDLSTNTTGRIFYNVVYSDSRRDIGRVDYSRCIHSSVFQSGLATECRSELREDGKLQYQPYTSDGTRVEILADEDATLTALTERFVYESGDWPAEYIWVDDEPETTEPETIGPTTPEPELTTPDSEPIAQNPETLTLENQVSEPTIDTTMAANSADNRGVLLEIAIISGTNGNNSTNSAEVADNTENLETTTDDSDTTPNPEEPDNNVGVPELGKEFGNKGWWVAPLLMLLATVAAIVVWWFLFFGEHQSNKERSRKKQT